MKFLNIGDVHGRPYWKIPIFGYEASTNTGSKTTINDFDKVIFSGDYVDSFDIKNLEINRNLYEIIELKKKYPNIVELLLGNHDLQYLLGAGHRCSGFRPEMQWDLGDMFYKNRNLFSAAYQYKNYIWSHAGIHRGWYQFKFKRWMDAYDKMIDEDNSKLSVIDGISLQRKPENLAGYINAAFERNEKCLFDVCFYRGGTSKVGGPFWADKHSTWGKPLKGYHQIVGHTPGKKITKNTIDKDTSITFIDTQADLIDEFYILEIND